MKIIEFEVSRGLTSEELARFDIDPRDERAPCPICEKEEANNREHYSTHPKLHQYLRSYDHDCITFSKLFALFGRVFKLQDIGDIKIDIYGNIKQ